MGNDSGRLVIGEVSKMVYLIWKVGRAENNGLLRDSIMVLSYLDTLGLLYIYK